MLASSSSVPVTSIPNYGGRTSEGTSASCHRWGVDRVPTPRDIVAHLDQYVIGQVRLGSGGGVRGAGCGSREESVGGGGAWLDLRTQQAGPRGAACKATDPPLWLLLLRRRTPSECWRWRCTTTTSAWSMRRRRAHGRRPPRRRRRRRCAPGAGGRPCLAACLCVEEGRHSCPQPTLGRPLPTPGAGGGRGRGHARREPAAHGPSGRRAPWRLRGQPWQPAAALHASRARAAGRGTLP